MTTFRCVILVPACLIIAACASTQRIPEPPSNPLLRADLSARRLTGRQQIPLSFMRTLHADRVTKLANGTMVATGRVYVHGGERDGNQFFGWPRHLYASDARWTPSTQTLKLLGWPILEYPRARMIATSADTTVTFSGETITTRGPHITYFNEWQ